MFKNFREILNSSEIGNEKISTWRKLPTQITASGFWFDLSMSPGNPVPQYYASSPNIAVAMAQSTDGGIFHGGAVTPAKKYLRKIMALTSSSACVPIPMILCDYLMYYPFLDESTTDEQPLTNSVTVPRYTDGAGVQVMAVCVAGHTGGATFQINYTNSSGVSGRISHTVTMSTQVTNGTIATTASATAGCSGPFIPLQAGDTGVRSIESITMNAIDVGLMTLVLVKPLAQASIRGADAPVEIDYLRDFSHMPEIKPDAYLNFICHPGGSLSGAPIHGTAEFLWR